MGKHQRKRRQRGSSDENGDDFDLPGYAPYGRQRNHYPEQQTSPRGRYSDVGYGSRSKEQYGLYRNRTYGDDRFDGVPGYRAGTSGGLYGSNFASDARLPSRGYRGLGPKGYQRSDTRLTEEINDRLTEDDDIDPSDVVVQVHNGEVTLDGTVPSREEKRLAEDIADQVSGVSHVQNNLRIKRRADSST